MAGHPPSPAVVVGDAPDAARRLEAAVASADAVLVHRSGTRLLDGAVDRLVRTLHRPHRRLVRVHSDAGGCYLARTELLVAAIHHGVTADELVADAPGLDRRIASAADVLHLDGPTPVNDPASGRWRAWVDGAVVGVRSERTADTEWEQQVAKQHAAPATLERFARRRVGRVRRELVRLRQRG